MAKKAVKQTKYEKHGLPESIELLVKRRHFKGADYGDGYGRRGGCAGYRALHELYPRRKIVVWSNSVDISGVEYTMSDNDADKLRYAHPHRRLVAPPQIKVRLKAVA